MSLSLLLVAQPVLVLAARFSVLCKSVLLRCAFKSPLGSIRWCRTREILPQVGSGRQTEPLVLGMTVALYAVAAFVTFYNYMQTISGMETAEAELRLQREMTSSTIH
jgi:hypothetical protein